METIQPFVIEQSSKKNLMSFFFTIWLIVACIIGINVLLFAPISIFFWMKLICIPLILIGILGIRLLFWLIFGKEKILIEKDKITCTKTGTFFLPKKIINLNTLQKFAVALTFMERENGLDGIKGLVTEMSYRQPYFKIINKGRISILYNDNSYTILNGMSYEEGKLWVNKLNEFYKKV